MSRSSQKLSTHRRYVLTTRAQELRDLRMRKDEKLAELIVERLKPFVADEIKRQLDETKEKTA